MLRQKRVMAVVRAIALGTMALVSAGCATEVGDEELATIAEESGGEQVGTQQEALTNAEVIEKTYRYSFGRTATGSEVAYWLPRFRTTEHLISEHKRWLQSNASEREATIRRSYQNVFKRSPSSSELRYWNANIEAYGRLCTWHEQYARNIGFAPTGWFSIQNWGPGGFTDYTGRTYNVPPG